MSSSRYAKTEQRMKCLIEWWPSTGRFMVNKKGDRREYIRHIDELRAALAKEAS